MKKVPHKAEVGANCPRSVFTFSVLVWTYGSRAAQEMGIVYDRAVPLVLAVLLGYFIRRLNSKTAGLTYYPH